MIRVGRNVMNYLLNEFVKLFIVLTAGTKSEAGSSLETLKSHLQTAVHNKKSKNTDIFQFSEEVNFCRLDNFDLFG